MSSELGIELGKRGWWVAQVAEYAEQGGVESCSDLLFSFWTAAEAIEKVGA